MKTECLPSKRESNENMVVLNFFLIMLLEVQKSETVRKKKPKIGSLEKQ